MFAILLFATGSAPAADHLTLGVGYFAENLTSPGGTVEGGFETTLAGPLTLPLRVQLGGYHHRRNHTGAFAEASAGLRLELGPVVTLGAHVGIGPLLTWHASDDGVFVVDDDGTIRSEGNFEGVDYAGSVTPEVSFRIGDGEARRHRLWFRARASWQRQVNQRSLLHVNAGIGYAIEFRRNG